MPPASINGIGFAFKDYGQVWAAMDGKLGEYIRGEITKRGLLAMDRIWDNGFRQITTGTVPITTEADLRGFKIRVPVSPALDQHVQRVRRRARQHQFQPRSTRRCRPTLSTGRRTRWPSIDASKLYEVQTYCSMTNHMWDGFWCLANRRAMEKLPQSLQDIVAAELNRSALDERADIAALSGSLRDKLSAGGLKFNDVNASSFRDQLRAAGFYKEWRAKYGEEPWSILEASVGALS